MEVNDPLSCEDVPPPRKFSISDDRHSRARSSPHLMGNNNDINEMNAGYSNVLFFLGGS